MTDMTVAKSKAEPGGEAILQEWADRTPVPRFGSPEDIGEACAMLVSKHMAGKGFMTGSDIVLDGGEWGLGLGAGHADQMQVTHVSEMGW